MTGTARPAAANARTLFEEKWLEPLHASLHAMPKLMRRNGWEILRTGMVLDAWVDTGTGTAINVRMASTGAADTLEVNLRLVDSRIRVQCGCRSRMCEHMGAAFCLILYLAGVNLPRLRGQIEKLLPRFGINSRPAVDDEIDVALAHLFSAFAPCPEAEQWWTQFARANATDRFQILRKVLARMLPPHVFAWYYEEWAHDLAKKPHPLLGLAGFRDGLADLAKRLHVPAPLMPPGLEEYLAGHDIDALRGQEAELHARQQVQAWLSGQSSTNDKALPAEPNTIDIVWRITDTKPPRLVAVFYQSNARQNRRPCTPGILSRLLRDLVRGTVRLPSHEAALIHQFNDGRYGAGSLDIHTKDTEFPVPNVNLWMAILWGSRHLHWNDGQPVRMSMNPAVLCAGLDGDTPGWMVSFPESPHTAPCRIPLKEARVFCTAEGLSTSARHCARLENTMFTVDIGDMPPRVFDALLVLPVLPLDEVKKKGTGDLFIEKMRRVGGNDAVADFERRVPVQPHVIFRMPEEQSFSVEAWATAADGTLFTRTPSEQWRPAKPDPAESGEMPDDGVERVDQPGEVGDTVLPDAPPETACTLAVMPREEDIRPLETWLQAVIPPQGEPARLPSGRDGVTWPANRTAVRTMLQLWPQRPAGPVYMGDAAFRRGVLPRRIGKMRFKIEPTGVDWLAVSVELEQQMKSLSPARVASALADCSDSVVRLPDGVAYYREEMEDYLRQVRALAELGVDPVEGAQRLHVSQLAGVNAETLERISDSGANLRDLAAAARGLAANFAGVPAVRLPKPLAKTLRHYQQSGVDFLSWAGNTFGGALLADDMGLGKTLQILAAITALRARHEGPPLPSLVVCPASVAHNWQRETHKFAPGLKIDVLEAGEARKDRLTDLAGVDIVVLNYALARRDLETLSAQEWLCVVVDEAQAIKNPDAAISTAVKGLNARFRFALTGTPIENRIEDIFSIMDFCTPGYLGSAAYMKERMETDGTAAVRSLRTRLRPVLLRRLKTEVAPELPDRIEERKDCTMTQRQQEAYLAELAAARELLDKTPGKVAGKSRIMILAALMRLREVCCDPALLGYDDETGSGKTDVLMELLAPLLEAGHKVLVFSQFVRMLERLRKRLEADNVPLHMLTGKSVKRHDIIASFEKDERPGVFLLSLKAGGTGLNLTSASHVVLFDPWWNPAVEAQAIDRTHRIGQDKTVVAFRLVTEGTIEERIVELQERKRSLVRDVLEEDAFNRSLTREDFEFLLK